MTKFDIRNPIIKYYPSNELIIEFVSRFEELTENARQSRICPNCGKSINLWTIFKSIFFTTKFPLVVYYEARFCSKHCLINFLEDCPDTIIWLIYDKWKINNFKGKV